MNTTLVAMAVMVCLLLTVWLGIRIRKRLPKDHLDGDTRDTVKLAMGLVATMSALVLGLLISSVKSSYDTTRNEVLQLAAKVAFLDRLLAAYGPEAAGMRTALRTAVEEGVRQMWSRQSGRLAGLAGQTTTGDAMYAAIQGLSPKDETQRSFKTQALSVVLETAQLRTLLLAQSVPSISTTLLVVVICWLLVIFLSFSVLAPLNATAVLSLVAAAIAVSGAIFVILELDQPLNGRIRIPNELLTNALPPTADK